MRANADRPSPDPPYPPEPRWWPGVLAWALGWVALSLLDARLDLANLAMVLVLASAVAALWLPAWASAAANTAAVLAFNWQFVPPRGTFAVDQPEHALLLGSMIAVSMIVTLLMALQRRHAALAAQYARRAEQLRGWGDTLRDADDPLVRLGELQSLLAVASGVPVTVLALRGDLPRTNDDAHVVIAGAADRDQHEGLWHCMRQGRAMGPGTDRHEHIHDLYLPLRGRGLTLGAAVFVGAAGARSDEWRGHAQALADQTALALQRHHAVAEQRRTSDEAREQAVRNTMLAAISHDYRTPLAAIMGAASSLDEQGARMPAERRQRLARSIVDEAQRLRRMTDNTLQLARLGAPGVALRCDWESAEDLVGAAVRRARKQEAGQRVRARLEPGLPLLWCDAMLLSQLIDNLVDNALAHAPASSPVEILVRRHHEGDHDAVVLAVRDRGPGIAPAWRERVFDLFDRGAPGGAADTGDRSDPAPSAHDARHDAKPEGTRDGSPEAARRGAGVGLAVCRAIARAHGGELRLRSRGHGGCSFECVLPIRQAPGMPAEPAGDAQPARQDSST